MTTNFRLCFGAAANHDHNIDEGDSEDTDDDGGPCADTPPASGAKHYAKTPHGINAARSKRFGQ